VGKKSGTTTTATTTQSVPSALFGDTKKSEISFDLVQRLQKLNWEIQNLPAPTERERQSMEKATKGMNASEMLCALQQFKEQRNELLIHEVLIGFLKEYLSSKGLSGVEIKKILDVLLEAEQKIAKAGFDFIENDNERTLLEGSALAEAALNMAATAVLPSGPKIDLSLRQDTHMESIERHFAYAFELADQITTLVPVTERNDKLTIALGFDVDEMFLGTEQEIQQRIDSGIMSKPEWWDNRMDFLFEPIGPEPIAGGDDKTQKKVSMPPRKDTMYTHVPYPTDKVSSDYRVKLTCARSMWQNIGLIFGGEIPKSLTRAAEKIVATVGVERVHFAINLISICSIIYGGTSIYYNYMALDHKKINIFVDNLFAQSKLTEEIGRQAWEMSRLLNRHGRLVSELTKLLEKEDVASFTLLDVRRDMYGEQEHILTPWLWNNTEMSEQLAIDKIEEARALTEIWLRYQMKPYIVADIPKNAKTFYEVLKLWYADVTEYGKNTQEMEETLDYMMKSFSMVFAKTSGGGIESTKNAFRTVQKFVQSLRLSEELVPKTRDLIFDIYRLETLNEATIKSHEAVINIARHSAEHTPALDRLIRDYAKNEASAFTLHTLRAMLALNNFVIAGTFDVAKAAAFMARVEKGASVSILEWAINAPVVSAQAGTYLLCNAYLLQWIASLIEHLESRRDWRPHCLQVFDTYCDMTANQLQAKATAEDEKERKEYEQSMKIMYAWQTYALRGFRVVLFGNGPLLGITGSIKAGIRYGPVLGAAFLYYSYVRYTGAWAFNLRENPTALLQLLPLGAHAAMGFYNNFQTPWDLVFKGIPAMFTGFHYKNSGLFVMTSTADFFRRIGDRVFNTHSYMIQQERRRSERIAERKNRSTSYFTFENVISWLIFLAFFWYMAGKIAGIANQPHWPQYQTREDRIRKTRNQERVLILE
jgi:hypothetical protein